MAAMTRCVLLVALLLALVCHISANLYFLPLQQAAELKKKKETLKFAGSKMLYLAGDVPCQDFQCAEADTIQIEYDLASLSEDVFITKVDFVLVDLDRNVVVKRLVKDNLVKGDDIVLEKFLKLKTSALSYTLKLSLSQQIGVGAIPQDKLDAATVRLGYKYSLAPAENPDQQFHVDIAALPLLTIAPAKINNEDYPLPNEDDDGSKSDFNIVDAESVVNFYATRSAEGQAPHHFAAILNDMNFLTQQGLSQVQQVDIALLGQSAFDAAAATDFTCAVNGKDVTDAITIYTPTAEDKMYGKIAPTFLRIAYKTTSGKTLPAAIPISITCDFSKSNTLPAFSTTKETFGTMLLTLDNNRVVSVNGNFNVFTTTELPVVTQTATMDGTYLYCNLDISFPKDTVLNHIYDVQLFGIKPTFSFIQVFNKTIQQYQGQDNSQRELQFVDKIYYNAHSFKSLKHTITSSQVQQKDYQLVVIFPMASTPSTASCKINLYQPISGTSTPIPLPNVAKPDGRSKVAKFIQFDVVHPNTKLTIDEQQQQQVEQKPLTAFEKAQHAESEDKADVKPLGSVQLGFTMLLRKTMQVLTNFKIDLLQQQYLFFGDFKTCTVNDKALTTAQQTAIVTTPGDYDPKDKYHRFINTVAFSQFNFAANSTVELKCPDARLVQREGMAFHTKKEAEAMKEAYYSLQISAEFTTTTNDIVTKFTAASSTMYRYPLETAGWSYILVMWSISASILIISFFLLFCYLPKQAKRRGKKAKRSRGEEDALLAHATNSGNTEDLLDEDDLADEMGGDEEDDAQANGPNGSFSRPIGSVKRRVGQMEPDVKR